MSSLEKKKELRLKEIIKSFFGEKEIANLSESLLNKPLMSSLRLSLKDQNQIEFQIEDELKFRSEIDLLITFAESKLEKNTYLELLFSLGQLTIISNEFSLAIEIHEKILEKTKNNPSYINLFANAHLALGDIFCRQSQWKKSFGNIKKAYSLFVKQSDKKGLASCRNLLATIYNETGKLKKAEEHSEKSLSLLEKKKEISLSAEIAIKLGAINNILGNYDAALSYYQRALLNFQKLPDQKRIAEITHFIGMTYIKLKKYESAIGQFDQCISISMQADYLSTLGVTYVSKAYLYTLLNDFSLASAFGDKAMEICFKTNDKLSIAEVYKVKGIIQRHLSNYETCENYLLTSLRINKELGNKLNQAETSFELALLYKKTNKIEESKSYFSNAIHYFRKINAPNKVGFIQSNLSRLVH
jgi:tetratricopeptide (TPR) repeat protein